MAGCFWGLVVKPDKSYAQEVSEAFHLTKACLDPSTAGKDGAITSLMVDIQGEEFILTNLGSKTLMDSLDLVFDEGAQICFKSAGPGTIHLSGYLAADEEDDFDGFGEGSDDDEDDEVPVLVEGKKRKMLEGKGSPTAKKAKGENGKMTPLEKALLEKESKAEAIKIAKNASKAIAKQAGKGDMIDDDDDDDDDEEDVEEEEDSDDMEEGEEEEDEDDEEDDDEEEEEEEDDEEIETPKKDKTPKKDQKTPNKPETNGLNKKGEKTPTKGQETPAKGQQTPGKGQQTPGKTPKRMIKGGIAVEDLTIGNGPEAKRGKMIGMYYDGKLVSNKKTFDKKLSGDPFKFRLGSGEVIKGWDLGIEGMKVGGKRRLTIPPKMAYGPQGAPPSIPPNATLVFEVECKAVS